MEPIGPFQYLVPVHHAGLNLGNGAVGTVIDHLGATRHGAGLQIVDAHALAAIDDAVGLDAQAFELGRAHIGNVVFGEARNKMGLNAIVSQRNSHIGLAATESSVKLTGLAEAQVPRSGQAKHHLAKSHHFSHLYTSIGLYLGTKVFITTQAKR